MRDADLVPLVVERDRRAQQVADARGPRPRGVDDDVARESSRARAQAYAVRSDRRALERAARAQLDAGVTCQRRVRAAQLVAVEVAVARAVEAAEQVVAAQVPAPAPQLVAIEQAGVVHPELAPPVQRGGHPLEVAGAARDADVAAAAEL